MDRTNSVNLIFIDTVTASYSLFYHDNVKYTYKDRF